MAWTRLGPGERRGYHHGNLREALIDAALNLIAQKGPAGFTFADAARSAGVSSAAPYRHYRDREALLADVARRGFEAFEAHLEKAWNGGNPEPFRAFEALGRAYLGFARDEPAYYSAMFEATSSARQRRGATPGIGSRLRSAAPRVRRRSSANAPAASRPPALMMSLHIWALSHGIASLFARGDSGAARPCR